jgi:hypothetical protein
MFVKLLALLHPIQVPKIAQSCFSQELYLLNPRGVTEPELVIDDDRADFAAIVDTCEYCLRSWIIGAGLPPYCTMRYGVVDCSEMNCPKLHPELESKEKS